MSSLLFDFTYNLFLIFIDSFRAVDSQGLFL